MREGKPPANVLAERWQESHRLKAKGSGIPAADVLLLASDDVAVVRAALVLGEGGVAVHDESHGGDVHALQFRTSPGFHRGFLCMMVANVRKNQLAQWTRQKHDGSPSAYVHRLQM